MNVPNHLSSSQNPDTGQSGNDRGKSEIILGVTGSIACYKACEITSQLTQDQIRVHVVLTKTASQFVRPEAFSPLSQEDVFTDLFETDQQKRPAHIDLADRADAFLIAPATANIIGKTANGIADDLLTSLLLANNLRSPVIFAPAMNSNMYNNPLFQQNFDRLQNLGYQFVEPEEGYMACGDLGKGRLANTNLIIDAIHACLNKDS